MSGRRVLAIVRRLVAEIRRDRLSIALLFVAPVLMTGLVAFILREGEGPAIDAVLVNAGGPPLLTGALTNAVEAAGGSLRVVADEETARREIADGRATLAVLVPADFRIAADPRILVLTNGLDPAGEAGQLAALQRSLLSIGSLLGGGYVPTIDHRTLYGAGGDDPVTDYAPAVVGFFAYFFVYLLTGVSFLRERTGGTLERLLATPVTRGEIVLGYTVGFGLFATLQVAALLTWVLGGVRIGPLGPLPGVSIGLGVGSAGSPLLAFLVVLLVALGAVSLGILCSTVARTELQIIQFIPLVISPQFLLSGVLFPVASLPEVIRPLAPFLPLSYAVDGLRQVLIRGADLGVDALRTDLLVLGAIALVFGVLATMTIRREVA